MWWHRCPYVYVSTLLRLLQMPPHLRHISLRLCYGSHHSYITGHYVCVRASQQLHHTSLHLWYGRPHSYLRCHCVCDMGVCTATSGVTVSVIQASPQLRYTSLRLWHGHPCIYLIPHYICDTGIPRSTSYITVSITQAYPQLPHTSLRLWYGRPHSYVIRHYVCDSGILASTSYLTASMIQVSLHLRHTSLRLWYEWPYSYVIRHCVYDTGVPSYVIRHCIWYGRSYFYVMEKAMAPHSSTLAWKIPWTEEPGGLQSTGFLRVGHDWATSLWLFTFMHQRRKWQPTPAFLPGESHGQRSLVGCHLWGVAQSRTRLKQLSSSSSTSMSYICYKHWGVMRMLTAITKNCLMPPSEPLPRVSSTCCLGYGAGWALGPASLQGETRFSCKGRGVVATSLVSSSTHLQAPQAFPSPASHALWFLLSCIFTLQLPGLGVLLPRPDAKVPGLCFSHLEPWSLPVPSGSGS